MSIMELSLDALWQFLKKSISFRLVKHEKSYFSLTKVHDYPLTRFIISLCFITLVAFFSLVAHFSPDDASYTVSN